MLTTKVDNIFYNNHTFNYTLLSSCVLFKMSEAIQKLLQNKSMEVVVMKLAPSLLLLTIKIEFIDM